MINIRQNIYVVYDMPMINKKTEHWYIKAKQELKRRKIRYRDVADLLDVETATVGHWMVGRNRPDIETVAQIARIIGMSLSELCENDPCFIINKSELALIEIFRTLTEQEKKIAKKLIESLKQNE